MLILDDITLTHLYKKQIELHFLCYHCGVVKQDMIIYY